MTPAEFASALMAYAAATRGSVTSWGRTVMHNRDVGGVPDSAHLLWVGADVTYDNDDAPSWREAIAKRVGLHLVHEGDHDHVQPA